MESSITNNPGVPPKPTSECIVCRKTIPRGALKCTECDSYQNKYVYFTLSGANLLKPILELAPIVGIAFSLWRIAFRGTANIKRTAECQEKKIYVTAINTGGQVGAIANPQLYEKRGTEEKLSDIKLKLLGAETGLSQILKPGDGVVLEYQGVIAGQEDSKFPSKDGPKNCLLEIRYAMLNFEKVAQSPGQDTVTCPCPENNP